MATLTELARIAAILALPCVFALLAAGRGDRARRRNWFTIILTLTPAKARR